MSTATSIQKLRLMAQVAAFAYRKQDLLNAASDMEEMSLRLAEWRNVFPGKTPSEIALTFATADWCIRANGKLMAENERLREQRPLPSLLNLDTIFDQNPNPQGKATAAGNFRRSDGPTNGEQIQVALRQGRVALLESHAAVSSMATKAKTL